MPTRFRRFIVGMKRTFIQMPKWLRSAIIGALLVLAAGGGIGVVVALFLGLVQNDPKKLLAAARLFDGHVTPAGKRNHNWSFVNPHGKEAALPVFPSSAAHGGPSLLPSPAAGHSPLSRPSHHTAGRAAR